MTELTDRSEAATPGAAPLFERYRREAKRRPSITVTEVIDRYMAQYSGQDMTRSQRLSTWQRELGPFKLEQCDQQLLKRARTELATKPALVYKGKDHRGLKVFDLKSRRKPKDPATLNRYMQAIGAVFSWAIENELAPKGWLHPCRGIKRLTEAAGRVRYLEADERARLFEAVKASKYPRLYALTLMAMKTGARRGELLALTWRDIDLAAGVATLAKTKNGDRRTLVLLPDVIEALKPFVSTDLTRYVFGSMLSKCQTPTSIDSAWRDAVARAKIKDFSFTICATAAPATWRRPAFP
jgi:integrase